MTPREMDWTGLKLMLEGIEPGHLRKRYKALQNAQTPQQVLMAVQGWLHSEQKLAAFQEQIDALKHQLDWVKRQFVQRIEVVAHLLESRADCRC